MLDEYYEYLNNASILLVGAGGIGCEVIKNLMLNGVKKLTIVDMDTIDVSNLNRQFLYLPEHVNKYKAEVARMRALEINPKSEVKSLVCDVNSWEPNDLLQYDVVLNALDNIKARSHINYCCIQSGVPLIESGSTGYNGQVYPIVKDMTKCYECDPLPKTSSIPVCSIRQIPEKPTHCIAWARMLYQLLFGTPDNNNLLTDLSVPTLPDLNNLDEPVVVDYLNRIFDFLFNSEVKSLLKMEEVWINRDPPKPLEHQFTLKRKANQIEKTSEDETLKDLEKEPPNSKRNKFVVLELEELYEQFSTSVKEILLNNSDMVGSLIFSKNDEVCVDFVSSAANLRMINFGIKPLSTWDVQSIAGSIVPAIASTNAIVASFQVVQLLHLLKFLKSNDKSLDTYCRKVWIKSSVMGSNPLVKGKLSQPELLEPPNPKCTTCQQKSFKVKIKSLDLTLHDLVQSVLSKSMGLAMVSLDFNLKNIYDGEEFEEDPEYSKAVRKNSLKFYGLSDNSILTVTDLNGDSQFELVLQLDDGLKSNFLLLYYSIFKFYH
ncbi:ubiquitin-activating enzyme e1, putative [Theileria annulata]|uniref:SUMO-activating enzyme subunit n=1 Tax=Theileria annulata TaxID=5874 RepID=Q4UG80_THEAN|nr:ubiquitin-activating enzyme e1, putative [Theileria annulata]CAI73909.1 ubiquitin-activating enzyme e1, putative [Theileria annulata]|eukprot:XP_954586.1 ubiquitin-activating enzyme e1, putative [Theileria annulata]